MKKLLIFNILIFPVILNLTGCGGKNITPPPFESPPVYKEVMGDYYLQPGDNLDVKFFYNPELNENITIRPDGKITLQLIDEIQAAGLTPVELDKAITNAYCGLLREPTASVIIREFGGQRIYVGGEVNSPRILRVVGKINALQAIFDAGGFKDDAKLSNVIIVSRGLDHLPLVREVNLKSALKGELSEKEYLLKPFDMVYVPKTNLAKSSHFITQIYKFIPPRVGITFFYELHNEPIETKNRVETLE